MAAGLHLVKGFIRERRSALAEVWSFHPVLSQTFQRAFSKSPSPAE
ncbi:hypothetical protein EV14_2054 [Prochlorococcus sp. MIT 0703]|nr:hypothetical protein EV14_2054 [Prochlorococcus sp. MIT 0703]